MLEAYQGHEAVSARIARTELVRLGFDEDEIRAVEGMIMATRMPQHPRNAAERVVADADLDVLGRPDFLAINRRLRDELERREGPITDPGWYGRQAAFLRRHRYFTSTARRRRGPRKGVNLAQLEALLAEAEAAARAS
jgi:predicted metal-dependent HD superfamily phosphohydrolase